MLGRAKAAKKLYKVLEAYEVKNIASQIEI